jgi:hypothetical protein
VRNEEVLHRVKEERNSVQIIKRRKADCIGHILCRNCLLKHVINGKVEERKKVIGRQGRRRKQLTSGKERILLLNEKALVRTLWRTCFRRVYGNVARQTTGWMNDLLQEDRG